MQAEETPTTSQPSRRQKILKGIGALLLVTVFLTMTTLSLVYYQEIEDLLKHFADWIKENVVIATVINLVIYSLGIPLPCPLTFMQLLFGFTYSSVFESQIKGLIFSTLLVQLAIQIGGCITIFVSRTLLRE